MPLSDTAIRNAKPTEKPYKVPDEKGMSDIEVSKVKGATGPTRKPFFMHVAVAA